MAGVLGRKKGVPKEFGYEDMRDYIRREMASEFDAMRVWDSKRQTERTSGLQHEGKSAEAAGWETVKGALQINGKSGRGMGQEVIKDVPVVLV
jgi:hypothetical protein